MNRNETTKAERAKLVMRFIARDEQALIAAEGAADVNAEWETKKIERRKEAMQRRIDRLEAMRGDA
jgi:hypothetical protein